MYDKIGDLLKYLSLAITNFYSANNHNQYTTILRDSASPREINPQCDIDGNLISKSGSLADFFRHRFSTKYFNTKSSLYYYGYRFYHPRLMRWLNRDPIEEEGGLNLYAFCQNDPLFYYDPNGESFENFSNFCAGDSLSFGITRILRRGINRVIEGDWDAPADVEGFAYSAGEFTEVAVEIIVSLGGATLRHVAKHSSRQVLEKGVRKAYRNAHNISGGVVHHINPLINRLNSSSDTKCWDSIDLNVYFYHLSGGGVNINGIPESVSISIEETWREQ